MVSSEILRGGSDDDLIDLDDEYDGLEEEEEPRGGDYDG